MQNNLLIMNRYTNPNSEKVTSQCHVLDDNFNIVKSYPKIDTDDLIFFSEYRKVMIIDVKLASNLSEVNIFNQDNS